MKVTISPGKAVGKMAAPPSKSTAHRLLICAGLADGTSIIKNVDASQDMLATIDCLNAMGAKAEYKDHTVTVNGGNPLEMLAGATLPCRECGSTLRFFIPLCLLNENEKKITGSEKLLSRPLDVYEKICKDQGIAFIKEAGKITIRGCLKAGEYEVAGNISSQFISGLLFALPLLKEGSRIKLIPPVESRPYIDMTIDTLALFGVKVFFEDDLTLNIPGDQEFKPFNATVEGDYSNAAYIEGFNLAGGSVELTELKADSLQGDKVYREHFEKIKQGFANIDLTDCPDLGPVLMAGAAINHGAHFSGTARLAIKESDRGEAMKEELGKLGIKVTKDDGGITVESGSPAAGAALDGHNDHRIVMALSMLLSVCGGSITGAQAVNKSLPDFFERIQKLGVGVTYDELDK